MRDKNKLIKNFSLVRGDTWDFNVKIVEAGSKDVVILGEGDKMFFSIKNSFNTDDVLIQKRLNDGITFKDNSYHIVVDSLETSKLKYQDYVYDIEVIIGSENSKTKTIKRGIITVDYEVTHRKNEV